MRISDWSSDVCSSDLRGRDPHDRGAAQFDRNDAVVDAVRPEDRVERRGDDRAEPIFQERPGGVLAARPASEIGAREQDLRRRKARVVEYEDGVGSARPGGEIGRETGRGRVWTKV